MTTDAFTDAATAAYEDYVRTPKMNVGTLRDRIAEAYMDAAMWARDHLAQQEATDAEVLAAREAVREVWRKQNRLDLGHVGLMEAYAHAALSAARAARRDEEKRDG